MDHVHIIYDFSDYLSICLVRLYLVNKAIGSNQSCVLLLTDIVLLLLIAIVRAGIDICTTFTTMGIPAYGDSNEMAARNSSLNIHSIYIIYVYLTCLVTYQDVYVGPSINLSSWHFKTCVYPRHVSLQLMYHMRCRPTTPKYLVIYGLAYVEICAIYLSYYVCWCLGCSYICNSLYNHYRVLVLLYIFRKSIPNYTKQYSGKKDDACMGRQRTLCHTLPFEVYMTTYHTAEHACVIRWPRPSQ